MHRLIAIVAVLFAAQPAWADDPPTADRTLPEQAVPAPAPAPAPDAAPAPAQEPAPARASAPAAETPAAATPTIEPERPALELEIPAAAAAEIVVAEKKQWEAGISLETHRLFIQNDLEGAANNKLMNFLYAYAGYHLTKHDTVEVRGYFYERFLADPGETGLRNDDIALYYKHLFPRIPFSGGELEARITGALSIPGSFSTKLMGPYTAPRLGTAADWKSGPWTLGAVGYGEAYIVKYREMAGGNPNPKWHIGGILEAEYALAPLPLTLGISGVIHRTWYYEVGSPPPSAYAFPGAVADPQFASQPMQGSYGYQTYVRWELPKVSGFEGDLTLAYGMGDPTLGYTASLHDGVSRQYLFWRTSSQLYAAFSVKY